MDFEWIAIALGDIAWISMAFVLGLAARALGLPPLVGFLATGFLLNAQGIASGEMLQKLSDLGITLLLFIVGLKLNLRTLVRPQVWAVTSLHAGIVVAGFGTVFYLLALLNLPVVEGLNFWTSMLIAFALSFSSTVYVVKALEEKGEMASLHGRIAVGILIMQDIAAVVFLAFSIGKLPTVWAFAIILLIPLRPALHLLLKRVGHGELLILYGFLLALGGAEAFELVGLKGDLGALILGLLIANHPKADELAKSMLGFKDLFLLGFFLSIGLSGAITLEAVAVGALLTPIVLLKSALFFMLLGLFRLRARTALLASVNLSNYSEFGLIVVAIGVANGWIGSEWLIILAVALSFSFVLAAGLAKTVRHHYDRNRDWWKRLQNPKLSAEDRLLDVTGARIAIIGMGGIGTGAYDNMRALHGDAVVGVDIDPITVRNQQATGRNVLLGDPSDADFWDRLHATDKLDLVMLALPMFATNMAVLEQLKAASFRGQIAATAKFQDEVEVLKNAGATTVFNVYTEAGAGFAAHVIARHETDGR